MSAAFTLSTLSTVYVHCVTLFQLVCALLSYIMLWCRLEYISETPNRRSNIKCGHRVEWIGRYLLLTCIYIIMEMAIYKQTGRVTQCCTIDCFRSNTIDLTNVMMPQSNN